MSPLEQVFQVLRQEATTLWLCCLTDEVGSDMHIVVLMEFQITHKLVFYLQDICSGFDLCCR